MGLSTFLAIYIIPICDAFKFNPNKHYFAAPASILDMTDGEKGQTALHKAAWFQRRTICVMLVGAGASLTKTDFQGKTPRIQVSSSHMNRICVSAR